MISNRYAKVTLALFMLSLSTCAQAAYTVNMPKGVTEISHDIYHLHMAIFWVCVGVGILVFTTMFYAILRHRKSRGAIAANFHDNTTVEMIWTLIPFAILVLMAIPATKILIKMEDHAHDADLSIKITGHQWRWEYEYMGEGVQFISNSTTPNAQIQNRARKGEHYLLEVDKPLVVPIGKKIRLLTTAADVIHSFWVPELGLKKDAIPGFINESWTRINIPGTFRGQCAELCGVNHGFMPIVIEAKPWEEYISWLATQKPSKPEENSSITPTSNTPLESTTHPMDANNTGVPNG